jgi:hypothetical protein
MRCDALCTNDLQLALLCLNGFAWQKTGNDNTGMCAIRAMDANNDSAGRVRSVATMHRPYSQHCHMPRLHTTNKRPVEGGQVVEGKTLGRAPLHLFGLEMCAIRGILCEGEYGVDSSVHCLASFRFALVCVSATVPHSSSSFFCSRCTVCVPDQQRIHCCLCSRLCRPVWPAVWPLSRALRNPF